jgi:hypothetical protein
MQGNPKLMLHVASDIGSEEIFELHSVKFPTCYDTPACLTISFINTSQVWNNKMMYLFGESESSYKKHLVFLSEMILRKRGVALLSFSSQLLDLVLIINSRLTTDYYRTSNNTIRRIADLASCYAGQYVHSFGFACLM